MRGLLSLLGCVPGKPPNDNTFYRSPLRAALIWDEESADTLGIAASLGCQVIEIRPGVPLAVAFRREVGAGRL